MPGAVSAIVMAAGQGTRMMSPLPKPLHSAAGRSILLWVLGSLAETGSKRNVVVVGHGASTVVDHVHAASPSVPVTFVEQMSQRGTGDAVIVGLSGAPDDVDGLADILVLPGDLPLLSPSTMNAFVEFHQASDAACSLLTAEVDDPTGLGRIIRNARGEVERIVEHRDATDEEREVHEINTSVYCFRQSLLAPALRRVTPDNAQGEFYLTDVVEVLRDAGHPVGAMVMNDPVESLGVNDRSQLAIAERELRRRINQRWMRSGVGMPDPDAVWIDADVRLGTDATVMPGTSLLGSTQVGEGAVVGPHSTLIDCVIGSDARVPHAHGTGATVAAEAVVAPFSTLTEGRPFV